MLGYFSGVKWLLQLNLDQLHNQRGGGAKTQSASAYANVLAEAELMAQSIRSEWLFKVPLIESVIQHIDAGHTNAYNRTFRRDSTFEDLSTGEINAFPSQ